LTQLEIRGGKRSDAEGFLRLVESLARFERLDPPTVAGRRRLVKDIFDLKRINLLVALSGGRHVGYALYFFTYSSFLAKPSLYLEDLFVLDENRHAGIGLRLFKECVDIAVTEGCGRMEWAVLKWNKNAIGFYERIGAKRLDDWEIYRLDEGTLKGISRRGARLSRASGDGQARQRHS
jgi:GNAT superfamily N-acetyltransferase